MFQDGPECAICKLLVQEIDSYIVQNKSAAEINATVYEFCNKLPAPLNSMVSAKVYNMSLSVNQIIKISYAIFNSELKLFFSGSIGSKDYTVYNLCDKHIVPKQI